MKTSLIIDDEVFAAAKKLAEEEQKTISEVISLWARKGRNLALKEGEKKVVFKPMKLGKPLIDLTRRKDWMDELDEDL